jgi:serine/threonine protein kinase
VEGKKAITYHRGYIEKTVICESGHVIDGKEYTDIERLYNALCFSGIPALAKPKIVKPKFDVSGTVIEYVLHIRPVGFRLKQVASEEESVFAIFCALSGLKWLHDFGWVHRDIRPPNILRLCNGNWMLIDFEYACPLDKNRKAPWPYFLKEEFHPTPKSTFWEPRHDLYQLRNQLLEKKDGFKLKNGEEYNELLSYLRTDSPSAADALKLKLFSGLQLR